VHGLATVTSKTNQERLITNSWRLIAVVANSRRLMGGLHYFHVACQLLTAGFNRFEFAAEALLNLAKSLQSTFVPFIGDEFFARIPCVRVTCVVICSNPRSETKH
jgi:hypothetical protein